MQRRLHVSVLRLHVHYLLYLLAPFAATIAHYALDCDTLDGTFAGRDGDNHGMEFSGVDQAKNWSAVFNGSNYIEVTQPFNTFYICRTAFPLCNILTLCSSTGLSRLEHSRILFLAKLDHRKTTTSRRISRCFSGSSLRQSLVSLSTRDNHICACE